jgi:hypothetical protein
MSRGKNNKYAKRKQLQSRWPLLAIISGVLLLVVGGIYAVTRPRQLPQTNAPIDVSGAPNLKVDRVEVNLGEVKLGKWVDVSFQLTNRGDTALRFTKAPYIEVKEGC